MQSISLVLLQAPGGGMGMTPIFLIGMVAVMYFFMIRPQQKRQKEQKQFQDNLTTGDKIVTLSGMHGRITRMNNDGTIVVEVDRNTNITMERSAISSEMTLAHRKKAGVEESAVVSDEK